MRTRTAFSRRYRARWSASRAGAPTGRPCASARCSETTRRRRHPAAQPATTTTTTTARAPSPTRCSSRLVARLPRSSPWNDSRARDARDAAARRRRSWSSAARRGGTCSAPSSRPCVSRASSGWCSWTRDGPARARATTHPPRASPRRRTTRVCPPRTWTRERTAGGRTEASPRRIGGKHRRKTPATYDRSPPRSVERAASPNPAPSRAR